MTVFEAVKDSLTTREAAESAGIRVGRNGMCCCPFHDDKHPSMKVDRRFHCFGCGADGDVIDFAGKLYGLSPKEAAEKLAFDFEIPYEEWNPKQKRKVIPFLRKKTEEQLRKEAEKHFYVTLSDYCQMLREEKKAYAPKNPGEEICDEYADAADRLTFAEDLMDQFLDATETVRKKLVDRYQDKMPEMEERHHKSRQCREETEAIAK